MPAALRVFSFVVFLAFILVAPAQAALVAPTPTAPVKKTFPNGTYWWRVRALAKDGTPSPWTAPRSIVKAWTAAPALQSPSQGAIMVHPTHPLVLRWSP